MLLVRILFVLFLLASPVMAQEAVFAKQALMKVKWANGNAVFPIPKDYTGDWKVDFWLTEGPQNGETKGTIGVQFNFKDNTAYDKAVLDNVNYEFIREVVKP